MRIPLLLAAQFVLAVSQQEHFLDVRQIVKGTIEAMQRLPEAAIQQQKEMNDSSTAKPEDLMSLFKLPADIMTNLAVGAGYLDEPKTSTYGPWIVARNKQSEDYSSGSWEEMKRKHHKRPEDDGLVNIKDLLRPLPPIQQQPQASPPVFSFSQVQGDTAHQDPLYRKQIDANGQVSFVPVYQPTPAPPRIPLSTSSSPFVVVTPLTVTAPRRVMGNDPRFEAQTFPPAVNPFQQPAIQQFPARIIQNPMPMQQTPQIQAHQPPLISPPPVNLPQQQMNLPNVPLPIPPAPKQFAAPIAVPNPQPIQAPQQVPPAQVEVQPSIPSEQAPPRKPILVQPVMKTKEITTTLPPPPSTTKMAPKLVHPIKTTENKGRVLSEETSASTEDDSIIHSEESEPTPLTRKSVISKTALRVRTIEHDAIRRLYSEEEETKPRSQHGKSKKKSHPAKKTKKVKLPPMDDKPETTPSPPLAERPTPLFEEAMADIEKTRTSLKRRRVHASKTFKIGKRKEDRFEEKEKMSAEMEQMPAPQSEQEEEEEERSIEATTMAPRRRSRLWRKQTVRPKSSFTTTETPTTTEEEEETATEEVKKEKKKKQKLVEKKRKTKKPKKRRTTTLPSSTTPAPLDITPQHCANIRSFARQFGIFDVRQFANKHCQFIENYYAELTCDRVEEYVDECQRH